MKLRNYFKKQETEMAIKSLKVQMEKEFGSIYAKPRNRLFNWMKAKPYRTLVLMFVILISNFILVYNLNKKRSKDADNKAFEFKSYVANPNEVKKTIHDLSFTNLMQIKKLKDSMELFSTLPTPYSHQDSLTIKRLLDQYLLLDPNFFNEVQKNTKK